MISLIFTNAILSQIVHYLSVKICGCILFKVIGSRFNNTHGKVEVRINSVTLNIIFC